MKWNESIVTKMIKDYSFSERLQNLGLPSWLERSIRSDLSETYKIINGISYYGKYVFQYFSSNWKFSVKTYFKN